MPRLASLWLPDLAIDRIMRAERHASPPRGSARRPDFDRVLPARDGGWRPGARWARETQPQSFALCSGEGALVTAHREVNRDVLAAVCARARGLGLEPGMPLTKARILVSGLDVRDADHEGDAVWLARLGLFAVRRWTPRAAASGPDGLWLDLTGTAHLFGGEERMCERILVFCRRLSFTARIAVAGTAGAAHALARFGDKALILCPSGREADALAAMPLTALRLDEEALAASHRLGLERIGELIAMPRAPLQRRFGANFLTRLDQAMGRAAEPFDPIFPEDPPSILLRFLEPIVTAEGIEEAATEAIRRLVPVLEKARLGVRRLVLACERVDGEMQRIAIGTVRATRDGAHLWQLLCGKIEKIEPGFGIEAIRLTGARVEPLAPRPVRLLSPPEPVEHVMAVHPDGGPMRFNWRGKAYRIAAADGPERLYGEWWKRAEEAEAVRDYFQVEDGEGKRFWLFRKGDPDMPGTGDLSWHMHGIFA